MKEQTDLEKFLTQLRKAENDFFLRSIENDDSESADVYHQLSAAKEMIQNIIDRKGDD